MLLSGPGRILIGTGLGLLVLVLALFTYEYVKYSRFIDAKLKSGPFTATSMIFASPRLVSVGDEVSAAEIVAQLRRSGYSETRGNGVGWFNQRPGAVEVFPGPDSYFDAEPGVIKFQGAHVAQIISLRDNTERVQYSLEPELITNLSGKNREKRRLVKFAEIPKILVNAVISAEDKRFFQHSGFDPLRIMRTVWVDVTERRKFGASTLSMQLARQFLGDTDKNWRRKAAEAVITLHLEQKLTKEEIFEYYVNVIPLGQRGSFAIMGFGEAGRAYFGKDLEQLTLPEAALLAGLIQKPSVYNPVRHPDNAEKRRNKVLDLMRENGFITQEEHDAAVATPVKTTRAESESVEAPYFVDLVHDELQSQFQDLDFQSSDFRVYTTLDLNLQRAAAEAVRLGMQEVDQRLSKRRRPAGETPAEAQAALIALDPETGAVKALIGGRNYGMSQLNRILAKRQPGSSFKPFVYAAALNSALTGSSTIITPATTLMDEPTTFWYDDKPYTPSNFKHELHGQVTVRQALAKSMNIPTVKLAEMVGYDAVEEMAKKAGMNLNIRPTPAIALGAYDVTPLEIAGAYTVFAEDGTYVKPSWISEVRDNHGKTLFTSTPNKHPAMDPRVAFLMTNMMQEVLRSGTGAEVRSRGFGLPAAGKTGTSRDGWFAGFTSKLICIVWVGFDDNRELNLEGAHSALPIWTEFMKRAHQYREYRNVHDFQAPEGVVGVEIDPVSGQLATSACPTPRTEYFISGTQPVESCSLHSGFGGPRVAAWETAPAGGTSQPAGEGTQVAARARKTPPPEPVQPAVQAQAKPKEEKKKGFFQRLLGVFK